MKIELKKIIFYFFIYVGLKIFSYFFTPPTPLLTGHFLNTIVSVAVLISAVYFIWRNDIRGWLIVVAEILLGGSGGYLSVGPVALRTALLAASLTVFFSQKIYKKEFTYLRNINKYSISAIIILIIWSIISSFVGYFSGHPIRLIFSDLIPYFFLFYYFPLFELWKDSDFSKHLSSMLLVAIVGNALFILFTFSGFSSHLFILQDNYYHWFRDVALGKITDLQNGFFRITLNEHLLLAPAIIYYLYKIIKNKIDIINVYILMSLLIIYSINLTRIYFLAIIIGGLFLIRKYNFKRAIMSFIATFIIFLLTFTALHLLATRFSSLGLEFFGLRLSSIASPQIEESSLSRMLLLPEIIKTITLSPISGVGLGASITVYSPVFKQFITTPHFDWGYLEILAEMGLVGLILWLIVLREIILQIKKSSSDKPLAYSLIIALLIINITSPALFHVLGIILLIYLSTKLNHASFEQSS